MLHSVGQTSARSHLPVTSLPRVVQAQQASLTAGYKANDGGTVLGSLTPVTSCGDYAGGGISFVDSEHEYFVGDYVRLHGLKTASLNGKVGTITEYIESSGRFGVVLHRRSEPKAVLKTNIQRYEPVLGELCGDCNDVELVQLPSLLLQPQRDGIQGFKQTYHVSFYNI